MNVLFLYIIKSISPKARQKNERVGTFNIEIRLVHLAKMFCREGAKIKSCSFLIVTKLQNKEVLQQSITVSTRHGTSIVYSVLVLKDRCLQTA